MAILTVRTFTDPVLRQKAAPIEKVTPEIRGLAKEMIETMYVSKGIGLAAPQVGVSQQLLVIDIDQDGEQVNPRIFINPRILRSRGRAAFSEGCLSIPGFNGDVIRPEQITLSFLTLEGQKKKVVAKGLLARVLQHEIDHLHGILFTDYLDEQWWESEEGQKMKEEHPLFVSQVRHVSARKKGHRRRKAPVST